MASFNMVSPRDFIPRFFEIFSRAGAQSYGLSSLGKDIAAGLTVGVVAMPLSMAFAIAAGAEPAQGLYTAIFAGFFISLLGGSKFQIGGPTGAFVVIIAGVIARHGMAGLTTATIMAGIWLVVMGVTGLGKLIKFIPYPVTTGFTTGIGLIIFSQQIKDFLGLRPASSSPEFLSMWNGYVESFATIQPVTVALGLGTLAVIILIRKFVPRVPGAVAGVVAAALVTGIFALPVETIGSIPRVLPAPTLPDLSWLTVRDLFRDSFAIALLAAIESLLSAVVADGMTGDRHNSNMELVAQGAGNIASAFFGGIPATGAIARTAANIKSGAVSPVAGIVHAVTLLLFVLLLAPLASMIPLVSLSAVLIVVSWDMADLPRFMRILVKAPKSCALVLVTTFLLTVLVDLIFAVEVGVVLAAFLFLRRMVEIADIKPGAQSTEAEILWGASAKSTPAADGVIAGAAAKAASSAKIASSAEAADGVDVYEITGPFFFGVADSLRHILRGIAKKPRAIVLRMRDVPAVDSTGIAALESFLAQCGHGKISLVLAEVREQPVRALRKSGFLAELGEANVKQTFAEALDYAAKSADAGKPASSM